MSDITNDKQELINSEKQHKSGAIAALGLALEEAEKINELQKEELLQKDREIQVMDEELMGFDRKLDKIKEIIKESKALDTPE